MNDTQMLIDGRRMNATGGATFQRRNPLTEAVVSRAPAATPADARNAVDAAAAAFKDWSTSGPTARRALLMKAADELQSRSAAFADAMAQETGATASWAGFNVHLAANMLREAAALTTQVGGEVIPSDIPGSLAMALRVPAESGICHINGPTVHGEAQMPFGGVKASGHGRFGGKAGIDAFTELRWVTLQTAARHYPF